MIRLNYQHLYRILLVSAASLSLLESCNYHNVQKVAPEINEVKIDEKFRVNLPENHQDGYTWSQGTKSLHHVEELNQVWHGNDKWIDFNYKTKALGTDTLYFIKRKYTDTIETRTILVKVINS
jgi:hypothetical protein